MRLFDLILVDADGKHVFVVKKATAIPPVGHSYFIGVGEDTHRFSVVATGSVYDIEESRVDDADLIEVVRVDVEFVETLLKNGAKSESRPSLWQRIFGSGTQ